MDSADFRKLVTNYTTLTPGEFKAIQELTGAYPYSQVLHLIASRGAKDQQAENQQAYLHRAAVYATDRTVLKHVMTCPAQLRVEITVEAPRPAAVASTAPVADVQPLPPAKPAAAPATPPSQKEPGLEGDALREDLNFQLHRLHDLMHQFDDSYEKLKGKTAPKAKKETAPPPAESGIIPDAPLIEEIKSSKRKPKIVSPKVAEQGEIIDNFIKVAPTLPRTKAKEPGPDLSEESVNYSDNIVSETLVNILLKQGKKAKAIEMLKKLIWKFPQKKAYFAAQIEALKG